MIARNNSSPTHITPQHEITTVQLGLNICIGWVLEEELISTPLDTLNTPQKIYKKRDSQFTNDHIIISGGSPKYGLGQNNCVVVAVELGCVCRRSTVVGGWCVWKRKRAHTSSLAQASVCHSTRLAPRTPTAMSTRATILGGRMNKHKHRMNKHCPTQLSTRGASASVSQLLQEWGINVYVCSIEWWMND